MKLELIVLFIIAQSYFGNLTAANFSMDDVNCSGDEVSLPNTLIWDILEN